VEAPSAEAAPAPPPSAAGGAAATATAAVEAPAAQAPSPEAPAPTSGAGQPQTAAAPEPSAAPATGTSGAASAVASSEAAAPAASAPASPEAPSVPAPAVAVTAVEADTDGSLFIAGTASTPDSVRVYLDDAFIGAAAPTEGGTWLLQARRDLPAGQYKVRADQVDKGGNVIVRAEVPFEREVAVAQLKPEGSAAGTSGAEASGTLPNPQTVIIKQGDNLWRLSRSMYGRGMRWSTIYTANKDQIRNPRWIYPGQVFVVPAGDTTWKK
jgi:nucleoid-associated protein YgaU